MRIFSLRGKNHDVVALDSIYGQHKDLLETIERHDAPAAVAIISSTSKKPAGTAGRVRPAEARGLDS